MCNWKVQKNGRFSVVFIQQLKTVIKDLCFSFDQHHPVSFFSAVAKKILFGGFPSGSENKESACNAEDPSLIPESGRSRGKEDMISLLALKELGPTARIMGTDILSHLILPLSTQLLQNGRER